MFRFPGPLRWTYRPADRVRTPSTACDGRCLIRALRTGRLRPVEPLSVLVTAHHTDEDPKVVARLRPEGSAPGEYCHSACLWRLELVDKEGDGPFEVLLAGVNNGWKSATLIALDSQRIKGVSGEKGRGQSLQILDREPSRERKRILLAASCINRASPPFPHIRS